MRPFLRTLALCGMVAPLQLDAEPVSPAVHFVDVADSAGIDFRYINGASGEKYMPEPMGSGAAFFDADGDSDLDLYILNGAPLPGYQAEGTPRNALYQNRGDGTFTEMTTAAGVGDTTYSMATAVGDLDNDGDAEIFVANFGADRLYQNRGDGVFAEIGALVGVADSGWAAGAAFADIDLDGDLDLYVANYMAYDLADNSPCWGGQVRSYCGPTVYPGQSGRLYRNDGTSASGTPNLKEITAAAGLQNASGRQLAAVFGDIDDDGDPDLFVANDKRPNFLFLNDGTGAFEEVGLSAGAALDSEGMAESAMGADLGDYDNDGRLDIVVATFQWVSNTLYRNVGDGFFDDVTTDVGLAEPSIPFLGMSAFFLDYDNDGYLDVFVSNGHLDENVADYDPSTTYAQRNQLFRNTGNGRFVDISDTAGPGLRLQRVSHGTALGDYDDDGDTDIFVSDSNTPRCSLLRNDGGNSNAYLTLDLRGTTSNRDGIGAKVRIVAGDLVQVREVRSAYGYMGANDRRLLVGLGHRAQADTIIITWPGGGQQTLVDITAGQRLKIVEEE